MSSGKINKYEFSAGQRKLSSDQIRIIKPAKFTFSLLVKTYEKQLKKIKDQRIKDFEPLKALKSDEFQELESMAGLFSKKMRNNETKNKLLKNGRKRLIEKTIYRTIKYKYVFSNLNRWALLAIEFILVKFIKIKLKWIKVT